MEEARRHFPGLPKRPNFIVLPYTTISYRRVRLARTLARAINFAQPCRRSRNRPPVNKVLAWYLAWHDRETTQDRNVATKRR